MFCPGPCILDNSVKSPFVLRGDRQSVQDIQQYIHSTPYKDGLIMIKFLYMTIAMINILIHEPKASALSHLNLHGLILMHTLKPLNSANLKLMSNLILPYHHV